jgi:hypothetical protein
LILLALACFLPFGFPEDTAPEPLSCDGSVETFCEYEYGGACPTYDDASQWTCDDYQLLPDDSGPEAAGAWWGEREEECAEGSVYCNGADDPNLRTWLFYDRSGQVSWIVTDWPSDTDCPGYMVWGYAPC